MTKLFVFFASLLAFMVIAMVLHTMLFPYKKTLEPMISIVKLTQQNALSFSSAYDSTLFNATYPEMSTLSRRNFIYDK